ncbi:hypothetical protein HID58_056804 [Brassica napus]|uniref:CASP-like protein n=1 Tax=Brassica napus TaxID=3708 RepID=A0ABQ8AP86_BRANA|nr:hypothetical protein HID58_056804 [Brassica napus]
MGLNKETKTLVVATIGTVPIKATLTAKFQDTPAFVFFFIANAMVSFHNLLMIGLQIFSRKLECKGFPKRSSGICGCNGAVFVAEIGQNGNKHAKWNKVCDRFSIYCDHGRGALIAAFSGVILCSSSPPSPFPASQSILKNPPPPPPPRLLHLRSNSPLSAKT